MAAAVNKIRNPSFSQGKSAPRAWSWRADRRQIQWRRPYAQETIGSSGVVLESNAAKGTAYWVQQIACKAKEYYHVSTTVTCELTANDADSGFVVVVQPFADGRPIGNPSFTPGLHRASQPTEVRAYFQAPGGIRRVELSVGIAGARGMLHIHGVRFMNIVEPDEESHVMAIPPPPLDLPPARVVKSLAIGTDRDDRPLVSLLSQWFGRRHVMPHPLKSRDWAEYKADAVLFPDAELPAALTSLRALERLAAKRLVVISLPAFAKLSRGKLAVRRVDQPDDPIHAKVNFASSHTRGFALADVFPYAWRGSTGTHFVQNHFRRTQILKSFCKKHGLEVMLLSMCCTDDTSERPICLYKPTDGGGLFVLDLEPVEASSSAYGETALAMHFLLGVLGQPQTSLGQYIVPERTLGGFRERVRDMSQRFPSWVVHEEDLPADEVSSQLVTVGGADQSYGLALSTKPLILVRSGLFAGDAESIYGAFLWFKQLVRMPPFACPYADALASRFRLAWIPCGAPWERREGFRRDRRPSPYPTELDVEPGAIAALVDVVSCSANRARIVVPAGDEPYSRYLEWVPRLGAAFPAGAYFAPTVPDGDSFSDRNSLAWRRVSHEVEGAIEPAAFADSLYDSVRAAGGRIIRVEIPGSDFDFSAYSIQRTDLTVTLLEHVIGLQYGLIAVNRRPTSIVFNGFPPLAPGKALIVDHRDPAVQSWSTKTG